ncbi:hypothetical protein [Robertmurraya sp. Marseille-Q9965]
MKPHRKNRSRAYYQHHRRRVIQKKVTISKFNGHNTPSSGYFAKGKVHCSCWMCTQKSYRDGYPRSVIVQLDRLNSQLRDYFHGKES